MNILLGVSGGIAAYKAPEVLRAFQRQGHTVRVILTDGAQNFVTKLTFETLSKSTVYTNLFDDDSFGTAHIALARWADTFVIAPATAETLFKFAHGSASDFLSTVFLAYGNKPIFLAPAMNSVMWSAEAVQKNLQMLQGIDAHIIPPVHHVVTTPKSRFVLWFLATRHVRSLAPASGNRTR